MKSSVSRLFPLLLLLVVWSTGFTQPAAYKHYEYKDINLKFDLPADFVFTYPYKDELGFMGSNALGSLRFLVIRDPLKSFEERRARFYKLLGVQGEIPEDVNFQSGTSQNGYLYVSTVTELDTYAHEVIIMLLSDPKHNDFNFFMIVDFGGEDKTEGPEGQQFLNIAKSFSPIVQ
jgi:hypothetical protein